MKSRVIIVGLASLLMSSISMGSAGAAAAPSPLKEYAHSKKEAVVQARVMLARVVVPDVKSVTHVNLPLAPLYRTWQVDVPQQYIVTGVRDTVVRWIRLHPPHGFVPDGPSVHNTNMYSMLYTELRLKLVGHPGQHMQYLVVDGFQLHNGLVRVRVDAYVGYIPSRTSAETIPASLTSGWLSESPDVMTDGMDEHRGIGGSTARHLDTLLNQLKTTGDVLTNPCTIPPTRRDWASYLVTFGGHHVLYVIYHSGCGAEYIRVYVDHKPAPPLLDPRGVVYATIDTLLPIDHYTTIP